VFWRYGHVEAANFLGAALLSLRKSAMPIYFADRRPAPSSSLIQQNQMGLVFRLLLAPPGGVVGSPAVAGYFYPDDTKITHMGAAIAAQFGFDGSQDLEIWIRNFITPSSGEQVKISIPAGSIQVSPILYYLKIGGKVIAKHFNIQNWLPPYTYPSAPARLELRLKRGTCQPWAGGAVLSVGGGVP
jgi:hypothetical protein